MTPSIRDMPRITVTFDETLGRWLVPLPDGTTRSALLVSEVEAIVAAEATGASIRYYRVAPLSESELRAINGDR